MKKRLIGLVAAAVTGLLVHYFYPEQKLPPDAKVDYIRVDKSIRLLMAYSDGKPVKTYRISLGRRPEGKKEYEGDMRTPEGRYIINDKNPNSGYHKNLGISYPNQSDTEHARSLGKSPGGDIKIHGIRNGLGFIGKYHRLRDWTQGCIAVTNREIDELYRAVEPGAVIEIFE